MAKKQKNPKKPMQRWKLYKVSGETLERTNSSCPKCGVGTFMAKHKDRISCGKCNYVEFTGSSSGDNKEEKVEKKEEVKDEKPKEEKTEKKEDKKEEKAEVKDESKEEKKPEAKEDKKE